MVVFPVGGASLVASPLHSDILVMPLGCEGEGTPAPSLVPRPFPGEKMAWEQLLTHVHGKP